MATLSDRGRITKADVNHQITRLLDSWKTPSSHLTSSTTALSQFLSTDAITKIDPFDQIQLAHVLNACIKAKSLSAAGRELFAVSRLKRAHPNDADRLRKYLARFGLTWASIQDA